MLPPRTCVCGWLFSLLFLIFIFFFFFVKCAWKGHVVYCQHGWTSSYTTVNGFYVWVGGAGDAKLHVTWGRSPIGRLAEYIPLIPAGIYVSCAWREMYHMVLTSSHACSSLKWKDKTRVAPLQEVLKVRLYISRCPLCSRLCLCTSFFLTCFLSRIFSFALFAPIFLFLYVPTFYCLQVLVQHSVDQRHLQP